MTKKPTTLIGGIDYSFNSNLRIGDSDWMVVEADESDKTFLSLPSDISVVTNIDDDHMENYETMKNLEQSFLNFANNIKEGGIFYISKIILLLPKFLVIQNQII